VTVAAAEDQRRDDRDRDGKRSDGDEPPDP